MSIYMSTARLHLSILVPMPIEFCQGFELHNEIAAIFYLQSTFSIISHQGKMRIQ